jgi:uncharacterized membrane protein YfcA
VSPILFILISLIVGFGAVLQGTIGFGLGVFAVPLLLLIRPQLVPGPLLLSSIPLTVLMTHRERGAVTWGDLKWALGGRIVGIGIAALIIAVVPPDPLAIASGAFVLLAVALSATGRRVPTLPGTLVAAGALSGVLGTAVSIGGPPMALLYQHESGPTIRATLAAFFLVGVSLSLVGLHFVGRFGAVEILAAVSLLPSVLVGFWLSRHTARWIDRGYMRTAVLVLSAATSLLVILRRLL